MPTLEQDRAKFALARIQSVRDLSTSGKFKTNLLKLPARLHNNGLGQTVAFYLAAGADEPEAEICRWLGEWLSSTGQPYADLRGNGSFIEWITGSLSVFEQGADAEVLYRRASAEARALATWLKRFAEAFIEGSATDD